MRLQKFLSETGFCSRREAEIFIRAGRILVNGKQATLGDKVTGKETLVLDGKRLQLSKQNTKKAIAFYKPTGVECSMTPTPWTKTLMDFDFGRERVFPIGSLDKDSHGLLLLTNDGELGNELAQRGADLEEEYHLHVQEQLTPEILAVFTKGVLLKNTHIIPEQVKQQGSNTLSCILRNGKNKQIRRLCDAAGLTITDLLRTRIGFINLGKLAPGQWRVLDEKEFQNLRGKVWNPTRPSRRTIIPKR